MADAFSDIVGDRRGSGLLRREGLPANSKQGDAMRWIADKTGHAVSQVQPNALVRLEVDFPVASADHVGLWEQPEGAIRAALRRLGRHTRRPVTTLRWDTSAPVPRGGLRTEAWYAAHLPPPETPTRIIGQLGKLRSPILHVGGPVQVMFTESIGVDARLGVPLIPGLTASTTSRGDRTLVLTGSAYGAVDPHIRLRALIPSDGVFRDHFERALRETSVRFRVNPHLLNEEFMKMINSHFGEIVDVAREDVEMDIDEGETRRFDIAVRGVADRALPFVIGVFGQEGELMSTSQLAVLVPEEARSG